MQEGSISDADVAANPAKYNGATVATEEMLTPDMLAWSLGAQVGDEVQQAVRVAEAGGEGGLATDGGGGGRADRRADQPTGGNQGGTPGSGDDGMS